MLRSPAPALLLLIGACAGDPTGPGVLTVVPVGASTDTLWNGAPGEPIPSGVAIRIKDQRGNPVAGASVTWEAVARNSQVLRGSTVSDARGLATAVWQLGTLAGEEQELRILVQSGRDRRELTIRARAVPHVVAQLRVSVDTPVVVRLGDSLSVGVMALDPFGNQFRAPAPRLSVADTTVGRVTGVVVTGGPKRGATDLTVTSSYVSAHVPLHVVQYVASIVPAVDTLEFTSLGAQVPVSYVLRDDKGGVVADTLAQLTVADTSVARVTDGLARSVAPGATSLRVSVGPSTAVIVLKVQQRVASLGFRRDTIRFDALRDTTTIHGIALDSLGSVITDPLLELQVADRIIAAFDSTRHLESLTAGLTFVTMRDPVTGISSTAPVVVRQVITSIQPSTSHVTFDALGDSDTITAIATDRLGSLVLGPMLDFSVADSSVVSLSGGRVRSLGPGRGSIRVWDPVTGTTSSVEVVVDQVATSLMVGSTFGSPVVNLSVGSAFPLTCVQRDRNGHQITRDPAFVGSLRGTVIGSGCADAQVTRSGYDTLLFASGNVQTRVGVIVATTPDSVGIITAAHRLATDERIRFVGEDLGSPSILALRPLVQEILAAYGNPTTDLGRARALRDWVARTAIHPHPPLHPDNSTSNVGVLPPGKTWADVNALVYEQSDPDSMVNASNAYWWAVGYDGYAMLNRLLGTLDLNTGVRADDGMMLHVVGARYQIRDLRTYRYPICTFQVIMLTALLASAGLHGMLISTVDHDPAAVFIPEFGRWVYEDPTFNEEYVLDGIGKPLSPTDLLSLSSAGEAGRLHAAKLLGPSFDPQVYVDGDSYTNEHPEGMVIMGSQLNNRVVGVARPGDWPVRLVQIDVPRLADEAPFNDPLLYARVPAVDAFPTLGVANNGIGIADSVRIIHLTSTFPNHSRFERLMGGGTWEAVGDVDVLPVGQCRVAYRSVDLSGNVSSTAVFDIWLPRAQGFVEAGSPGSERSQARYCTSFSSP